MELSYIVVPFVSGHRGSVQPGSPINLKDREAALRTAERASEIRAGVMVLEQSASPSCGVWEEPRMIWHRGRVPIQWIAQLAA